MNDGLFVSLDLGTGYCKVVCMNNALEELLIVHDIKNNNVRVPNLLIAGDPCIYGQRAFEIFQAGMCPESVLAFPKFDIVSNYTLFFRDCAISPLFLTQLLVGNAKHYAEEYLYQKVERAVLVHPSSYNRLQRETLKSVAKEAGFREVYLLADSIAVTYYYEKALTIHDKTILVINCGASTSEISLLYRNKKSTSYGLLAEPELVMWGGNDIDFTIYNYLSDNVLSKYGQKRKGTDYEFLVRCQKIKEQLSIDESGFIDLFTDENGQHYPYRLMRSILEEQILESAEGVIEKADKLLQRAKAKGYPIDKILLCA